MRLLEELPGAQPKRDATAVEDAADTASAPAKRRPSPSDDRRPSVVPVPVSTVGPACVIPATGDEGGGGLASSSGL